MSTEASSGASYAYVDPVGDPLDMSYWVKVNVAMTGLPVGIAVLGFVRTTDHTSVRAGVWLGVGLTCAVLTLSRVWTLLHDRRYRGASRDWWVAHHAATRRKATFGACFGFVVLAGWLLMAVAAHANFVAAVLVGPIFGVLAVLALLGDSAVKRRSRARAGVSQPRG